MANPGHEAARNSSSWAGVVSVFARLVDDGGRPGGLTGFVVRQGSPGLRIGPEARRRWDCGAAFQNSLFLDDVFPVEARTTCSEGLAGGWKWPRMP